MITQLYIKQTKITKSGKVRQHQSGSAVQTVEYYQWKTKKLALSDGSHLTGKDLSGGREVAPTVQEIRMASEQNSLCKHSVRYIELNYYRIEIIEYAVCGKREASLPWSDSRELISYDAYPWNLIELHVVLAVETISVQELSLGWVDTQSIHGRRYLDTEQPVYHFDVTSTWWTDHNGTQRLFIHRAHWPEQEGEDWARWEILKVELAAIVGRN